jgi:uncharacterized protein (DUF1330 family)
MRMAGMWVVHIEVHDDQTYAKYIEGSTAVVAKYGGEFVARGGCHEQKEGKEYPRNVLIKYPTFERALEAYDSEEYQAIIGLAKESSDRTLTILEVEDLPV